MAIIVAFNTRFQNGKEKEEEEKKNYERNYSDIGDNICSQYARKRTYYCITFGKMRWITVNMNKTDNDQKVNKKKDAKTKRKRKPKI